MAVLFNGTVLTGTSLDDFMFGYPGQGVADHTINGDDGDDLIIGDADYFYGSQFGHIGTSAATAYNITNNLSAWSLTEFTDVLNSTTVPHAMVYAAPAAGTTAWYAVTVAAGATITIDVDHGDDFINNVVGGDTDTSLQLLGTNGVTVLASNSSGDSGPHDLSSQSPFDPFIQYTFSTAGTYFIEVYEGLSPREFEGGEEFLLNVSLTGQAVDANDPITGNDTLNGGDGDDVIHGCGGNDTIDGGVGKDSIVGGAGNDIINGGDNQDTIFISGTGAGRDEIDGGGDGDELDLSGMSQFVWVNLDYAGDEVQTRDGAVWRSMANMTGVRHVTGSNFDDFLYGDASGNQLFGGDGNDVIYGRSGIDLLIGDAGNDSLYGEADDDELYSDAGNDYLNGGSGNDEFSFSTGYTTGFDTFDGGSGTDTITTTSFIQMAWVDLATAGYELYTKTSDGLAWLALANVSNIENVVGTAYGDQLYGDTQNNRFEGFVGNDWLDGRGGYDTLLGEAGNDTIIGGDLSDTLDGGSGNDTFVLASNLTGIDTIEGGGDSDTVDCSAFLTKAWVDLTYAAAEVYTYDGTWKVIANTNSIENAIGSAVADELYGDANSNNLSGGGGADIIQGRGGVDALSGGTGSDTFKFVAGDSGPLFSFDTISDFAKGAVGTGDKIDFTSALSIGGSTIAATANQAQINATTGMASFAAGSGTTINDAVTDVVASLTAGGDAVGEFAFFRVNGAGPTYMLISDGLPGINPGDVLIQLPSITAIGSINITGGDLTILT